MNVILPQATRMQIGMKGRARRKLHPTLWLLHGMSDDHTIWARRTSIERYAAEAGLAVVMPAVALSWYQNMASGPAYGTFLREELPQITRSFFPLSSRRKDNFVAGLSMGGYGAFLLALSQPEKFAAAASLSGVLDIASMAHEHARHSREHLHKVMKTAFGNLHKVRNGPADLFCLAKQLVSSSKPKPALYACCGSKDRLLQGNQRFVAHAAKIGLPILFEEHSGFDHHWGYWERQIQQVIQWLPL